jgi:hypothetical protein
MLRRVTLFTTVAVVLVAGACDSPTTAHTDEARVTVLLTDAPHELLESAVVDIARVELLPADGPPVVIATDPGEHDLLQLQDGVTAVLGSSDVEPGRYLQLRMIVRSATVTLKDEYTFRDGSRTKDLHVPSGAQSGIKIRLVSGDRSGPAGILVGAGETIIVVDFDVSQNFVMQGGPTAPIGVLFKPVLRAVINGHAGSIAGSVSAPSGVVTEGLSVTATLVDADEDDAPATTLVKENGTFKLHFLTPGTYIVTIAAPPAGHTVTPVQRTVGEAEHVTGVQLVVAAS